MSIIRNWGIRIISPNNSICYLWIGNFRF